MATETETPTGRTLSLKREPKASNRIAGENDKSIGENAVNDALIIVFISWGIVFALAFSLREYIK